jgi:hypothetical protein
MKINSENWYPCYLNPSYEEILELAATGWDTIRILAEQPHMSPVEQDGDIVIASGYGNCHSSIMDRYAIQKGGYRKTADGRVRYKTSVPHLTPYILYHAGRIALFNLEDCSGSDKARYSDARKFFCGRHQEILKDIILASDLAL